MSVAERERVAAWTPVLGGARARRATRVAHEVIARLADPARVEAAIAATRAHTTLPLTARWLPASVAEGYAGLALAAGYADACAGRRDSRAAHVHLAAAVAGAGAATAFGEGLFSGLTGLAFVASMLSEGGTRYGRLLAGLDAHLLPRLAGASHALRAAKNVAVSSFDAISGSAGWIAYLLNRTRDARARATLVEIVADVTALAGDDVSPPRWYTPPECLGDVRSCEQYPHGNLNCGLAHGVPGVLAALALAHRGGVRVHGMTLAIRRAATWIAEHRKDDAWGVNWPYAVALQKSADGALEEAPRAAWSVPARSAWCYGPPGIARALWLAGDALAEPAWTALAIDAMQAVLRRPPSARGIAAPTLCHGVAGLLAVVLRFAHDTRLPLFVRAAVELCDTLLDAFEPESLLGYRDTEPGGNRVDRATFLDGAPGTVLPLLAAASAREPAWDRLLLLS